MSLTVGRMAVGLGLLVRPEAGARLLGARVDPRSRLVIRALGARHVLQAAVLAGMPSRRAARRGVAVDLVHACSAAALALVDRQRRRPALIDAGVATAFAVAGRRRSRRLATSHG
jgi:hypothetical protein